MRRIKQWALLSTILISTALISAAQAAIVIPAGGSWDQDGGTLDFGGTSLQSAGQFKLGSGQLNGLDGVTIAPGGQLDAGSGSIAVAGPWTNSGSFLAGSGSVVFADNATGSTAISGNSLFHNLSITSTSGQTWRFAAGSTQQVNGLLTIYGTPAQPIQLASSVAGQLAYINLLPGGTQNIHDLGVSDLSATGQRLAAGQVNRGGSGNAINWFAALAASVQAIPSLSMTGVLALCLCMLLLAYCKRHTSARRDIAHPI